VPPNRLRVSAPFSFYLFFCSGEFESRFGIFWGFDGSRCMRQSVRHCDNGVPTRCVMSDSITNIDVIVTIPNNVYQSKRSRTFTARTAFIQNWDAQEFAIPSCSHQTECRRWWEGESRMPAAIARNYTPTFGRLLADEHASASVRC